MFLHIKKVEYLKDYQISVTFNNGRSGVADLSDALRGGVFEALRDIEQFSQVTLDAELETVVWPNGADLAPEFVYFQAFKHDPTLQTQFKQWGYAP
jgi:hypothetical protein